MGVRGGGFVRVAVTKPDTPWTAEAVAHLDSEVRAALPGMRVDSHDARTVTVHGHAGPMFGGTLHEATTFVMGLRCGFNFAHLPPARKLMLLSIMGDVEPELGGPFDSEDERVEAARDYRRAHGDEDGLFRVDATGDLTVEGFAGGELSDEPRRCVLCRCDATGAVFGIRGLPLPPGAHRG